MDKLGLKVEPLVYHSRIKIPYTWSMGKTLSRFVVELGRKKIWGNRCPSCNKVYAPPKSNCPVCFVPIHEWLEIGPEGSLETFTVARYPNGVLQEPLPVIFGIIKLDRADTGLLHHIKGVHPEDLKVGMRLKPKFKDSPQGDILDIECFLPVSEVE